MTAKELSIQIVYRSKQQHMAVGEIKTHGSLQKLATLVKATLLN